MLAGADFVLCEDTRHSRKLLSAHGLRAELRSYHEHNEQQRTPEVISRLRDGRRVALITDAGTPSISDPGFRLVRAAIEADIRVVPLPGASAPITALVASGLPVDRFAFFGFAPRKRRECRELLVALADFPGTTILFDSPRRVARTLELAAEVLGADRRCALARELTKLHEEILRGTIERVRGDLADDLRGEVTLLFGPPPDEPESPPPPDELRRRHRELLAAGVEHKEALRRIARATGLRRRDVYEAVVLEADRPDNDTEPPDGDAR